LNHAIWLGLVVADVSLGPVEAVTEKKEDEPKLKREGSGGSSNKRISKFVDKVKKYLS